MARQQIPNTGDYLEEAVKGKWTNGPCPPAYPVLNVVYGADNTVYGLDNVVYTE